MATFDVEEPLGSYWESKLASISVGDHFLVACDDTGRLVGFAYSGTFRTRPAYDRTRETSVYLSPAALGGGLGTRLYCELLELLRQGRSISSSLRLA